jgi:hypothetical protein
MKYIQNNDGTLNQKIWQATKSLLQDEYIDLSEIPALIHACMDYTNVWGNNDSKTAEKFDTHIFEKYKQLKTIIHDNGYSDYNGRLITHILLSSRETIEGDGSHYTGQFNEMICDALVHMYQSGELQRVVSLPTYLYRNYRDENGNFKYEKLSEKVKNSLIEKYPIHNLSGDIPINRAKLYINLEKTNHMKTYYSDYMDHLDGFTDALLLSISDDGSKMVDTKILTQLSKNRQENDLKETFILAQTYAKAKQFESGAWKNIETINQMDTMQKKAFLDFIVTTQSPEKYLPQNLKGILSLSTSFSGDERQVKLSRMITQLSQQLKEEVNPLIADRLQEVHQSLESFCLEDIATKSSLQLQEEISEALPEVFEKG